MRVSDGQIKHIENFVNSFKKHNKVDFEYGIERGPIQNVFYILNSEGEVAERVELSGQHFMNEICRLLERIVPEKPKETAGFDRMLKFFKYDHLPTELQIISKPFSELAEKMAKQGANNPAETMAGLRKLLEAKDCAVRAQI